MKWPSDKLYQCNGHRSITVRLSVLSLSLNFAKLPPQWRLALVLPLSVIFAYSHRSTYLSLNSDWLWLVLSQGNWTWPPSTCQIFAIIWPVVYIGTLRTVEPAFFDASWANRDRQFVCSYGAMLSGLVMMMVGAAGNDRCHWLAVVVMVPCNFQLPTWPSTI